MINSSVGSVARLEKKCVAVVSAIIRLAKTAVAVVYEMN